MASTFSHAPSLSAVMSLARSRIFRSRQSIMGLSARYFLKSRGTRFGSRYALVSAGGRIARRVTSTVTMASACSPAASCGTATSIWRIPPSSRSR